ncbi:concanavalin A-like lectin/glucanase domain-containing protein [Entophlyctis helioformis]|nr:concanavalin A-like lectin/glucanase domain-containing protein [Entophlyctis helioformis]
MQQQQRQRQRSSHNGGRTGKAAATATAAALCVLLSAQSAFAQVQAPPPPNFAPPDCVTGRFVFNDNAIRRLGGVDASRFNVDPAVHNFTLDYGSLEFDGPAGTAAKIGIVRPIGAGSTSADGQARGTRISTSRYLQYGRITARFKPVQVPGVVTTFITFSDIQTQIGDETTQDEIDWEIVGKDPSRPEYNVFTYKALGLERGSHGGPIPRPIDPNVAHDYTIDWRRDRIIWSIDGVVQRTLLRTESRATNPRNLPPGEFWFPVAPSRIQISLWDGTSEAVRGWAGYPITWGNQDKLEATFEYIDVQCYNNNDQPVARWSADGSGARTSEIIPTVPQMPVNPKAAPNGAVSMRPIVSTTAVVLLAAVGSLLV